MKIHYYILAICCLMTGCQSDDSSQKAIIDKLNEDPDQKAIADMRMSGDDYMMRTPKPVKDESVASIPASYFEQSTELFHFVDNKGNDVKNTSEEIKISDVSDSKITFENGHVLYMHLKSGYRTKFAKGDVCKLIYSSQFAGAMYARLFLQKADKSALILVNEGSNSPIQLNWENWIINQTEGGKLLSDNASETIQLLPVNLTIDGKKSTMNQGEEMSLAVGSNKYKVNIVWSTHTKSKGNDSVEALPYQLQMVVITE